MNVITGTGVEVNPNKDGPFQMFAHVVGSTCDLPARAIVQNIIQFNGAYGCTYCEEPGVNVRTSSGGNVHTIPFHHESPKGTLRTKESTAQNALEAIQQQTVVIKLKLTTINYIPVFIGERGQRSFMAELFELF